MKKDFETLLQDLTIIHKDFKPISVAKIRVEDWAYWKCKYGCKAYGKHLTCPPYTPTPNETRKLLEGYDKAIITRFIAKPNREVSYHHIHHYLWDAILKVHGTMFELEKHAFLSGYYKAFAMISLPCSYCEQCIVEKEKVIDQTSKRYCNHQDKVRPSMEGCGINIFKTVETVGYKIEVLASPYQDINLFGLLLLE